MSVDNRIRRRVRRRAFLIKRRAGRFMEKFLSGETMNYRQVIAILLPIFVDQAFIILLSLLNTAMISSSGMAAVSAVSMVDSVNIFLLNVFIAIATGGTVIVAQYKGAGNGPMVEKSAAQSVSAVALVSFAVGALMILLHTPVLSLLFGKAEPDVMNNARIYLIGSCVTYPFIGIVEAVCGALRGVADTRPSLWLSMITNGSYVVLNLLFITLLHGGIWGMVISLFLSRLLGMVCSLVYLIRFNHSLDVRLLDLIRFHFPTIRKILFIGLPFAAEQMFFNGGKILTQTFVVQLGTLSMAVNAIVSSLVLLFQMGANACNLGVVTVVGQCMGRRNIRDARKFIHAFLWLGSLSYVVTMAVLFPFLPWIVKLFSPPQEIVHTIYFTTIMTVAASPFLWSTSFIIPSALRAAGDSRFTSIASMLSMWLFRVVLGYILGIVLPFGVVGVWAAMVCEWGVRSLIFQLRRRGDKWYAHRLVDD